MIDIGDIPGVTRAEADSLAALTLHTTSDLLRTNRAELQRQLPALARTKVVGWQAFAALGEIDEITTEAVAALRRAGADGLAEFAGWSPSKVATAVPAATADQIAKWQKDAVRLLHTGVVNGTVTLRDGTPVEGAEVTIGGRTLPTDARGRFRSTRLALDGRFTVTVHHPLLGHRVTTGVRPSRSSALLGRAFVLVGRPQPARVLSQRSGDRLPPIGSAPITTRATSTPPPADEILLVLDRYRNNDARVASRFLDFVEGRFVRRTYRIPAGDLPAGLNAGDDLVVTGGTWVATHHSTGAISRRIRVTATRRKLRGSPTSVAEAECQMRLIASALSDTPGRR